MPFATIPFTTDEATLAENAIEYVESKAGGYVLAEGDPIRWMLEAAARMAAEDMYAASAMPTAAVRKLGQSLYKIDPGLGAPATGSTTWTLSDTLGFTITAGTAIVSGDLAFTVDADVVVPAGSSSTAAGAVSVTASDSGSDYNGVSGPADPVNALARVSSVAFVGSTANGVDTESDDEYLARLGDELALQAPRPILPRDFEVFAARNPEVDRVVALDGFVGTSGTSYTLNNERAIGICAIKVNGQPISTAAKTAIAADLDARREINFVINMLDPTYTTITVNVTVKAKAGVLPATAQADVLTALNTYLNPGNWGKFGDANRPTWVNQTVVRFYELIEVVNQPDSVDYVVSLSVNGGTADITMTGAAPLPTSGSHVVVAS